ncbi:FK506-binding protein-like [Pangasianodon hypophthalmus]|uniref:FK506-binding protein-like n=1 Tax=Pangasianodon hypophthalmus TaxID=310915 RepID=UPI000F00E66A|nr:FK506-binding protein-like [Pangasianodon hypophthalmus]XP_026776108.3 FK506-binding protein-like [Pangasianodon hypophthalmus]XP_026776109.3 FK506-binding protein-like [Pangasianodon hypophthalmus]XP_026776110.3 FK506-binding protein-like [Pangasianodon hypophthalmus]XP_034167490.2 FK506-binding protein-like [Pangasianodon hypophthalmus]XP_053096423.1 FK506-binding protein-like [Pangasianodon hypophthalmus]
MATETNTEEQVRSETSWISVSPSGLWEVHRRWKGERKRGDNTPLLGSICKIRVCPKNHTEDNPQPLSSNETVSAVSDSCVQVTEYPRSQDSVLQVPLDSWTMLRMGEGQCDIIEGCLEGMRAGETCEFTVRPHQRHLKMAPSDIHATQFEGTGEERQMETECFSLQLHSFTPGKESWQMLPTEKWTWVLSHKQRGSQRFGKGDIWGAMHSYCSAVKLLITLKGHTRGKDGIPNVDGSRACDLETRAVNRETEAKSTHIQTEEEYRTMKAELHSNLSLCQLRLGQPAKAKDSSSKAAALDPANIKAWYRLGQACLQLEDFAEARQAFGKVLELQPGSASAQNALKQVNAKAKEFDNKLGQRLSKMFT